MKLSLASSFLLLYTNVGGGGGFVTTVSAFTPPTNKLLQTTVVNRKMIVLSSSSTSDAPKKKVLTAADVMAKSSSVGQGDDSSDPASPSASEAPKIFTPQTYAQFQSSLLTLEKRISNGPNSLSLIEVNTLENELSSIIKEMKEYNNDPKGVMEKIKKSYDEKESSLDVVDVTVKKEASKKEAVPQTSSSSPAAAAAEADTMSTFTPPKEQEDLEAEGGLSKGYGLAPGTTNTYAIPGMDEMNPEEYRAKLQETISARQAVRRKEAISSGNIGNRNSSGYLDALSKGGGTDPLRRTGGGDGAVSTMKPKWQPNRALADE